MISGFRKLLGENRKGLSWILCLSVLSSLSVIISPIVIGKALNILNVNEPVGAMLLILAVLYLADWLIRFLQQFLMALIGPKIVCRIRTMLFEHFTTLPVSFFDRNQHGELMSRLTNDVDNISTAISNSLSALMTSVFSIVGIFCIMVGISPLLTMISLGGAGLIVVLIRIVTGYTQKYFSGQQRALGKMNGQIEEIISGENIVKAFCLEENVITQFEEYNEELYRISARAQIWSGYLMPLTNVINNLSYVGISVAGGILAVNGTISLGMISGFLLYVRQFLRPFVDIANIYNDLQAALAGAERILDILDEIPEPQDEKGKLPLILTEGEIEFRKVGFGYTSENQILRDISVKIPAGMKIAIVGSTGSGKTTMINLLLRFYDIDEGEILLDGHDLRKYEMRGLRNAFGVVLQDPVLFTMSIRDNIAYGRQNAEFGEIEAAARAVGADAFIQQLPNKYDTILTQGGMELSQGERQLLTIARAVFADAPILILDEATSSVDSVTEQKIQKAVQKMTEKKTSFIIAHRLSTIRDAGFIIVLEHGRIVEVGNHDELLRKNGRYASMYRAQTE